MEIFLDVPEEVRIQRDAKGLYAVAGASEFHMAGMNFAVDLLQSPDISLNHTVPVEEAVVAILRDAGGVFSCYGV